MAVDIKSIKAEAEKQIAEERAAKAKTALVGKLRQKAAAEEVVKNIDREIADLEASIADGSFWRITAFGIENAVISAPHLVRCCAENSHPCCCRRVVVDSKPHQRDYNRCVQLAMRHRDFQLYGISGEVEVDRYSYDRTRGPLVFDIEYMSSDMFFNLSCDIREFEPIDARPQYIAERKSIKDFDIFATPLARTEEIIVEPQDVMAMLEQIKKMQAPGQAEIRQRDRARDRSGYYDLEPQPRQVFHAQILSIADRRAA